MQSEESVCDASAPDGALPSLRFVDFSGQDDLMAGCLFAAFGADVVQVEQPGGADFRRACELGSDLPLSWHAYGAGRRSVGIDPGSAEDRARLRAMGRTDLIHDPRFGDAAARRAMADTLDAIIAGWDATRAAADVERLLQSVGVPAHVVATAADLAADPHVAREGIFARLPREGGEEIVFEATRYDCRDTPAHYVRPTPTLGRDSNRILALAGYDAAGASALRAAGVVA
jgi:crotonobetainyl-CoA:carnitine CoA-transferase CaiB-like acyl-CoA transferase